MCHESARKEKNGRRRNGGTNHLDVIWIFCGKLRNCPARVATGRRTLMESGLLLAPR
jgi:hypothetical protein